MHSGQEVTGVASCVVPLGAVECGTSLAGGCGEGGSGVGVDERSEGEGGGAQLARL